MKLAAAWLLALAGLLPATAGLMPGAFAPAAAQRHDFASTPTTLPRTVVPTRYDLQLDLDPARDTFGGQLALHVQSAAPVREIVLHASGLEVESATLVDGPARRLLRVHADAAAAQWRLEPADGAPIGAGSQLIEIRYRGRVQRSAEGLYRAEHRQQGRPARWLATQLQAVHARGLFPGFDEPVFRAVFELSVRAPTGLEVVSNMPRTELLRGRGGDLHRFAPTPPMPSYLLALAVGRFDMLEGEVDGLPLRILTVPGKREQARYAMEQTRRLVPYFTTLFGQPYALPKLDQLAVPGTREGGMEDWGLVSYAEELLLFDPLRGTPERQRSIFTLLAHEISHQWFGNLVSVASWQEIWLNEAFATWMERKAAMQLQPQWHGATRRRAEIEREMERDAGTATRAMRGGAVDENRVHEVFDGITYVKGAAVLAMLEGWLGEAVFRRGLAAYIAERRFKPATAGDLWFHLGAAAGRDVAAVASSWTDQPGLPLVEVEASCAGGSTLLRLRQRRFMFAAPAVDARWRIPLTVARGTLRRAELLDGPEGRIELPGCDEQAIVVNAGGEGFYRVLYAPTLRARLLSQFAALAPGDRLALLGDSFALAQSGRQTMAAHFELLALLPQVADASRAALFGLAGQQLAFLDEAFAGSALQPRLRAAARALLAPELARLGWSPRAGEDDESARWRGELIERLAAMDDRAVVAEAQSRFVDMLAGGRRGAPPSTRRAVLKAIGSQANDAEFRALLSALHGADDDEDRWIYAGALAAGRDPARARRLLAESLAPRLPPNTASSLPGLVAATPGLAELAYDFSLRHFDALARLTGGGAFGTRHWLLPGALGNSNDPAFARRMVADQQRLLGAAGNAPAARVAAQVELRAAVRERESGRLGAVLDGWAPRR